MRCIRGWRGYFRGRSQKPKKVSRCVWVNIPFKKDDRKRETSPLKGRRPFYRGPSFTKCSIPLRQDWVNVPPLPLALLIPPLPLPFRSDLLPWFIWWKEFCTGLWLWWYPYTVTFSPRQMFLSQNTVTFIPKSPYKHIKWSQHVYVDRGWQKWRGQRHECWGAGEQTRRARNREADRQTYRQDGQKEVSDICSGQLMTPGWPAGVRGDRGQKRVDNSHKCCNGRYFEFNSLPGSARLHWFIISYHFTQNFPFYMLFWFSAELSDNGWRWLLVEPL